jgi:hypothetical protein
MLITACPVRRTLLMAVTIARQRLVSNRGGKVRKELNGSETSKGHHSTWFGT